MKKKDVIRYLRAVAKRRKAAHKRLPRREKAQDWWDGVTAYAILDQAARSLETNGAEIE